MNTDVRELIWDGPTGPFRVMLDEGVFVPSSTSREMAEGLVVNPGETVIDIGCGSGVLSFVAARMGADRVYGTDPNEAAITCAARNAQLLGLGDRTDFRCGSLFEPLEGISVDVVIGDVSGIPDELAAVTGWFDRVPAGGPTGAELPRKLLGSIGDTLAPGGRLYLPTGTLQDEAAILTLARELFGDNMEPVLEREFPLPDLVAKATATARMMKEGLLSLHKRGSRLLWSLRIWRCVRT